MARILIDPNPFCYGSISNALAIAPFLVLHELILLATGTAKEIADPLLFGRIIDANVKSEDWLRSNGHLLETVDIYLAISNNTNIPFIKEKNIPIVFIDALFWMNYGQTLAKKVAKKYFILDFPGVREKLKKESCEISHPVIIPPLGLSELNSEKNFSRDLLVINLGGGESPFIIPGNNSVYPILIANLLNETLKENERFDEIWICGGERLMESFSKHFSHEKAKVGKLPKNLFLDKVRNAKLFITSPGTNAVFEAFRCGVPTFFLPPQNLSQEYQMEAYEADGLTEYPMQLRNFDSKLVLDEVAAEKQGTLKILKSISELNEDPKYLSSIRKRLIEVIEMDDVQLKRVTSQQERWSRKYLLPGGEVEILSAIESVS